MAALTRRFTATSGRSRLRARETAPSVQPAPEAQTGLWSQETGRMPRMTAPLADKLKSARPQHPATGGERSQSPGQVDALSRVLCRLQFAGRTSILSIWFGAASVRQQFGFRCSQPHRLTAPTPLAGNCFKHTVAACITIGAASVGRQTPCRNVVPVAADQHFAARMTTSGLTGWIMNIASIDIPKARIRGDQPRRAQRLRRCRWMIYQLPVRMKGSEMQRHVGGRADPLPRCSPLQFHWASRSRPE